MAEIKVGGWEGPAPTSAWARLAALGVVRSAQIPVPCQRWSHQDLLSLWLQGVGQGGSRRSQAFGWDTLKPWDGEGEWAGAQTWPRGDCEVDSVPSGTGGERLRCTFRHHHQGGWVGRKAKRTEAWAWGIFTSEVREMEGERGKGAEK